MGPILDPRVPFGRLPSDRPEVPIVLFEMPELGTMSLVSKMEDGSKNEGRVQKWRTGPKMEGGSGNGGGVQKWRTSPKMEDGPRNGERIQKSPHMPVTLLT